MGEPMVARRFLAGSKRRGILSLLGIFVLAILLFTIAFHSLFPLLEGRDISWPQALLFILETITTVGFGELLPFRSDLTILFTIVLILAGVFMIFLSIPILLEPVLARIINSPPPTQTPREMKGHVVIVGYGNLARALIESLIVSDLGIVIVESDEAVAREVFLRVPVTGLGGLGGLHVPPYLGACLGGACPLCGHLRGREDCSRDHSRDTGPDPGVHHRGGRRPRL